MPADTKLVPRSRGKQCINMSLLCQIGRQCNSVQRKAVFSKTTVEMVEETVWQPREIPAVDDKNQNVVTIFSDVIKVCI